MTATNPDESRTRIGCEIDLDGDGKACGFLRVPHSVHRSAYGWLPVPIVRVANGDGPTVLLMSGNHGDEYEGQVALTRLARALEPGHVRGRVFILTMANFPAALAGLRTSPIDEGNLNRSFPGDANGNVTAMLAHFIGSELLSRADAFLDLHSGGSSLDYVPSVLLGRQPDGSVSSAERRLATAFGAPLTQVFPRGREDRTSVGEARRREAACLGTELGGAGTVSPAAARLALQGTLRVLDAMDALVESPIPIEAPDTTRFLELDPARHYCFCPDPGLFEPAVELGDEVVYGQLAGWIHDPGTPWRAPYEVGFEGSGVVVCKRIPGRVERGDCLFHLAAPPVDAHD